MFHARFDFVHLSGPFQARPFFDILRHSAFRQYFVPVSVSFISLTRFRPGLFDTFRHSAFRQYFMPVSISFISLARFRPGLFGIFRHSAFRQYFMPVSISFISLARFRPGLFDIFFVIRLFGNVSCPFRFRSSLWPVSGPAFLTFSVIGSSAISHARFDTFRNGCSTL